MILNQLKRKVFAKFQTQREPVIVQKPLFFMHIPKTAGTSLYSLIGSRFPAEACACHADGQADQIHDVNQFQFVSGHAGFEFLNRFRTKPIVVTFLRHPIDHALSNYFFQRSFRPEQIRVISQIAGEDPDSDLVARRVWTCEQARRFSLRELLLGEPELAKIFFVNIQTQYLAGLGIVHQRDVISCARENLAKCEVVGLTERLEESVGLLCHEMGWQPFADIPRHNTTRQRMSAAELDDESRATLVQLLGPDLALYESAQQLFEQRLQAAAQCDQSLLKRPEEAVLPEVTDFSFAQPFIGAGWSPREKLKRFWACWTGPGTESWLEFRPPVATHSQFRCEMGQKIAPQVLQSVQVRINDHPISLRHRRFLRGRTIFEGDVPADVIRSNRDRLRIHFTVNNRWRPCDVDQKSNDDRWLGISVGRIQVTSRA